MSNLMEMIDGRVARSALLLLAMACLENASAAGAESKRPNVLFIAVDDLNHWVGYLGRNKQTKTPNIDRLAARGVWFTRSYCAAPVCNPSRAAIMSGRRPGSTGIYDNGEPFGPAIPAEITLTTQFRKAGYHVVGAGKIFHGSVYRAAEWDDWHRGGGGGGARNTAEGKAATKEAADVAEPKPAREAVPPAKAGNLPIAPLARRDEDMPDYRYVDYVIEQLNKQHDRPFFIACGLTKPHLPWSVPQKYYELFPLESIELPPFRADDLDDLPPIALQMANSLGDHKAIMEQDGETTWKQAIRAYLASIAFCDAMIGRLLDAYDKSPERDNTIIVFWGDHGWHLGEKHHWRKFALWEESTRAPLIWVVPGLTKPNARCDRTIDFMTIYPTLMDLCGLPAPAHLEGKSIRKLLTDPAADWDEPAVTTYRQNNHSVRSESWRYTRYADGGEEVYDETADPYEWTNLAKSAGAAQAKATLGAYFPKQNVEPARPPITDEAKAKRKAAKKKQAKPAAESKQDAR